MPPDLVKAHQELDAAVDACYGKRFANKKERIEFLLLIPNVHRPNRQKHSCTRAAKYALGSIRNGR
jgi:hypothetical protein